MSLNSVAVATFLDIKNGNESPQSLGEAAIDLNKKYKPSKKFANGQGIGFEEVEEMLRMSINGFTYEMIARKFKLFTPGGAPSKGAVAGYIYRFKRGEKNFGKQTAFTKAEDDTLRALSAKGLMPVDIAPIMGKEVSQIRSRRQVLGIKRAKNHSDLIDIPLENDDTWSPRVPDNWPEHARFDGNDYRGKL